MSRFTILLPGNLTLTPRLMAQIKGSRIIAADSGMRLARSLRLTPELWMGDFDSADPALMQEYDSVPRLTFARDKDMTDGELSIHEALKRGATSLILVGGLGGQTDHITAHLSLLLGLALRGVHCFITTGAEEAYPLLPGTMRLDTGEDERLSIVPWSEMKSLSLRGVKWPLIKRDIELGSTLTLSNVALGTVAIELDEGCAIIFTYPQVF